MTPEIFEGFKLSPQQRHLWSLITAEAGEQPYCSECCIRIEGPLDVRTLEGVFRDVVNRHEILRTEFRCPPSMQLALQVILDEGRLLFREVDVTAHNPAERERAAEALWRQEWSLARDLEQEVYIRALLARISPSQHLLWVGLPALCAD